jgi:hypothetical protein
MYGFLLVFYLTCEVLITWFVDGACAAPGAAAERVW